jgi:hypothetical protein
MGNAVAAVLLHRTSAQLHERPSIEHPPPRRIRPAVVQARRQQDRERGVRQLGEAEHRAYRPVCTGREQPTRLQDSGRPLLRRTDGEGGQLIIRPPRSTCKVQQGARGIRVADHVLHLARLRTRSCTTSAPSRRASVARESACRPGSVTSVSVTCGHSLAIPSELLFHLS